MGYANPIERYGVDRFVADAKAAGVAAGDAAAQTAFAQLWVSDSGCGIDEATRLRLALEEALNEIDDEASRTRILGAMHRRRSKDQLGSEP